MARPIKLGLDYFPHDTHSNDDTALALIEAEFGIAGYAVYFKLLEFIYSQGYAALWFLSTNSPKKIWRAERLFWI